MSEPITVSNNKSGAAQQIIIELIRAGKISYSNPQSTAREINELYENLLDGFRETHNR
ncbi:hypothetical protein SAMN05216522_11749 [Rosenbergiella nectarea]|uniref:Uncharacterized protein n=1 Tax=Rosenbergiella nectarea TaxID=988801 RepID=A0A1H9MRX1_9GAMM|nr:hypothetical protein SAMN05216522_11749 [Rosenbergiella nectarea]